MATNVGAISIDYVAKPEDFIAKTRKVETGIDRFTAKVKKKFKGLGRTLKNVFNPKALFAGAVSGTLFGGLMADTADYSSKLVEAADIAGIGVTQFEKLSEVLKGDGMGFDEAASATRRFAKRIGEMRLMDRGSFFKGIESIMEKFPDLGEKLFATVKDKSKSPLEVLQAMLDLAQKANLGVEETSALFDLGMGLQGRKMGATFMKAAEEFGSLQGAMDEYGKFITMTEGEHRDNKGLGQQFTNMAKNVSDGVRKIMSTMADPLSDLIERFNEWLLELKKDPEAMDQWVEAFKEIMDNIKTIIEGIGATINAVKGFYDWWSGKGEPTPQERANNPKSHPMGATSPMSAPKPAAPSGPGMASSGMTAGVAAQAQGTIPQGLLVNSYSGGSGSGVNILAPLQDLRPTIEELNASMRGMINSMIEGTGSFRNVLDSFLDSMIQRALVDPIAEQSSKGIDAFFGALFGGGKANGGMARGLTLVGEKGPELVDFARPGQVYSNASLSEALRGGGGVSITYNIQSTDGPGVRAAIAEATPGIVSMANNKMMDDVNRPGAAQALMRGQR